MQKRILIADDHYVVLMGAAFNLKSVYKDLEIDFSETYEDVKVKISKNKYDLLLLDIGIPGSLFHFMIKDLREISPLLKILMFTAHEEKKSLKYIDEGANGYLNKRNSEDIIEAVQEIFQNGYYYPQSLIRFMINKEDHTAFNLSRREFEILRHVVTGESTTKISDQLNIKASTVSTVKKRILAKFKAANLAELIKKYNETF
ncbi:LuxR C-terminal-related transcriptional regulator [Chryseobacterium sp. CBSDS_008]|uniref:LuxR C-terminal-related transcriptional regulator n=1 Tax=Chryseobacterium sp. CBSDS_008 TaxID=3415265 RepID=UPI003CF32C93